MQKTKDFFEGSQDSGKGMQNTLAKYVAYYPLILLSLAVFIGAGYYYIRITPPKYQATTLLMIKNSGESGDKDLVENALQGNKQERELSNEIVLMTSGKLMQRVVDKYGYNISYFIKGRVLTTDVYKAAPFRLIVKDLKDSLSTVRINLKNLSGKGGTMSFGKKEDASSVPFTWNKPFAHRNNTYVLVPQQVPSFDATAEYIAEWRPVADAAGALLGKFKVEPQDKHSNVLSLGLITQNLQRSVDILNSICTEYNLSDIEERNKLSESTVRFIDERLSVIAGELKGVEGNLENYQDSRNLIDIKSQADQSFQNANTISNSIKELNIKQGVVAMISGYFNNNSSSGKLVPSSMGLEDPTLAALIAQYNELQLRKDREAPLVGPNNLMIQDMNNQLSNLKTSILESLNGISRTLRLQESQLQGHNTQYRQFLSSVPHSERVMQEIKRKQGITEGLYLYLLQKREEAAISSTSASVSHYKQVDPAYGFGPVEPNKLNIYLCATLLGLFLPIGFVYSKDLFNNKIESREEITRQTAVPIVGDVVNMPKVKHRILSPKSRNLLGEQLRSIRTNLFFLFKGKQTFLVTSSTAGEGKSTISINLASVLATPGKKVALLEFDIRKPSISNTFGFDNDKGITDYLNGEISNLASIKKSTEQMPGLHVYPSGSLPTNPADVLLSNKIAELFAQLKKEYDFIVVDSAPAGMVSDPFLLEGYCDATLFIVRQRYTQKKQLQFINDLYESQKLSNMVIVLNDVKTGGRYGYYGYGYDNKDGYYGSERKNGAKVFSWRKGKKLV